ncbi:MAG: hypothetical protein K0A89_02685 [ANME-2 cluster archaeon]|nr:hypothetical protein [ANME-2 cluster archaeon]
MNEKDEETLQAAEDMPGTSGSDRKPLTSGAKKSSPDTEGNLEDDFSGYDTTETTSENKPNLKSEAKTKSSFIPKLKPKPKPEPTPPKEVQKEVVIIREVEKKQSNKFVKKMRRSFLAVFLIIALVIGGSLYAWTSGMEDLRDDTDYLIVVVYKDVPKAASVYHKDVRQSEIIEITELGALSNRKQFFEKAENDYGRLDRMIIIDVDTLKALSTDSYILYETGNEIYVDDMYKWIVQSEYPPSHIIMNDNPSTVAAKILKAWIDHYSDQLLGGYGGYSVRVILNAYRADKILIYPGNSALTILKYVAVEKLVFPV